jgi:hypothetical protein
MPALLLLSLLVLGTPATTGKGQCDAKPFTLKKPAQTKTAAASAEPKTVQASPSKPKPAAKPAPKVAIGCKQPASK